jgi:hypothetical protein
LAIDDTRGAERYGQLRCASHPLVSPEMKRCGLSRIGTRDRFPLTVAAVNALGPPILTRDNWVFAMKRGA